MNPSACAEGFFRFWGIVPLFGNGCSDRDCRKIRFRRNVMHFYIFKIHIFASKLAISL